MARARDPRVPGAPRLLLRLTLRGEAHEILAGDLEEEFRSRAASTGVGAARRWYWRNALASMVPRGRSRRGWRPLRPTRSRVSRRSPEPKPGGLMQDLGSDVRFALRTLRRNPLLVVIVTFTLGLGIGANTAMYSILHGVLLAPLPYPEADRLVAAWEWNEGRGWMHNALSPANFLSWRDRTDTLEDLTVHGWQVGWALTGGDRPIWVRGRAVYYNFFGVLGLPMALGRSFDASENWSESDSVILGHGLWMRAYAGDPEIIGRRIVLDGRPRTVVGVASREVDYPDSDAEIWVPLRWAPEAREQEWFRRAHFVHAIGRLAPGATLSAARDELAAVTASLEQEYPATNVGMRGGLTPLHDWIVGDSGRPLVVIAVAMGAVLLIACANIANVLLSRAVHRQREVAVRSALGAGRFRLLRQFVTESLLLAALGGGVGLMLATLLRRWFLALGSSSIPRAGTIGLDVSVLAFTAGLSIATGLLFGAAPATWLSRSDVSAALQGTRATGTRFGARAREVLVIAQVAVAVAVVAGAAVMLESFGRLRAVDPGFDPDNVLVAQIELPGARYGGTAAVTAFYATLVERLEARPEIARVSLAADLPLLGSSWTSDLLIEGREYDRNEQFNRRIVDASYFATMAVPILAGRGFTAADTGDSVPVVVINETLARRFFGAREPIGSRVAFSDEPTEEEWRTVVGVVGAEKLEGLASREWPEILVPLSQEPSANFSVLMRYPTGGSAPAGLFRAELRDIDAELPIIQMQRLRELLESTLDRDRLLTTLLGSLGGLALGLAAVGIYGVMAYGVSARTREIGIRIALGAGTNRLVWTVVARGLALTFIGLVLGMAGAVAASGALSRLLFQTDAADPLALVGVAAVSTLTALAACWLPARRAARVDPLASLREE